MQVNTFEVRQYGLHKVDELRNMGDVRGLRTDGLKAVLVERLARGDHQSGGGFYISPSVGSESVEAPMRLSTPSSRVAVLAPTTKQLNYARVLAARKQVAVPPEVYVDRAAATLFLDSLTAGPSQ